MAGKTMTVLLLAVVPALAQGRTGELPYVGLITGQRVNIRSAPAPGGQTEMTRLSHPAEVIVVGKTPDGWLKIRPPQGSFSVIEKNAVRPDASGKAGTVILEGAKIYGGSHIHGPSVWPGQLYAASGDRVKIIGQAYARFYKIAPPKGVYMWVYGKFVKPKRGAPPTVAPPAEPIEAPATAPGEVPRPAEAPVVNEELRAALKAVRALETELQAEYGKPAAQRNLVPLLAKYEKLKAEQTKYFQGRIDAGIKSLKEAIRQQAEIKAMESRLQEAEREKQAWNKTHGKSITPATPTPIFSVHGILSPSEMFPGGATGPKRYTVHDRDNPLKIVAYAQNSAGTIDLARYVGKLVGIVGRTRFHRELALTIVEAAEIIVLDPDTGVPRPPAPRVGPMPVEPPRPVKPVKPPIARPVKPVKPPVRPVPGPEPPFTGSKIDLTDFPTPKPKVVKPKPKVVKPKPKVVKPKPKVVKPKPKVVKPKPKVVKPKPKVTPPKPKPATKPAPKKPKAKAPEVPPPTGFELFDPAEKPSGPTVDPKEYE